MTRRIVILLLSVLACCVAVAQPTNDVIQLRATVQEVVILSGFSGTVTPVDVDARYALTVRIISTTPAITNFPAASNVTFAIHSPSRLFIGEPVKGKTYDFSLRRETENGAVRYTGLKLRMEQTNNPPASPTNGPARK